MAVAALAVALILLPLVIGTAIGRTIRGLLGRRLQAIPSAIVLVSVPTLLTVIGVVLFPLIGLWDGVVEGLLLAVGVVVASHHAFADRTRITLAAAGFLVSLLLLELICRLALPPPPAFPKEDGPNLLLANALRIGALNQSWDARCKEVVCSILYGDRYPGIFDAGPLEDMLQLPRTPVVRTDKQRRVLHVGDSMVFGMGVSAAERFTTKLEQLEPGTEHINLGIPGTAPDAYFLVAQEWIATHPVDLVVMYVLEGNDIAGLDDVYPCCGWQPLLAYGDEGATRRCPTPTPVDFRDAGLTWLLYNSPPPYLLRVLIGPSAAAGHVSAAIVIGTRRQPRAMHQSQEVSLRHFEMILQASQEAMQERATPFVVIALPSRFWIEHPTEHEHLTPKLLHAASQLGIPGFDALEAIAEAMAAQEQVFMDDPSDPHFNPTGHLLMARWLSMKLPKP